MQELHDPDELTGDLGGTLERGQRDRQGEALTRDGLGPGELAEAVVAVDAPEAGLPDTAERQSRHGAKAMTELTLVMPVRIRRAMSMPALAEEAKTEPARP